MVLFFLFLYLNNVFAEKSPKILSYCVPVEAFNLDPFREVVDGKDMAYLQLITRSYISTVRGELGVLDSYEFSPDGKIFKGHINSAVKFNDGTSISSYEGAFGVVEGFLNRPLGKRVFPDVSQFKHGIRIVDDKTFEIHFKSDIKNLAGVIREAISTGSSQNRVWPLKLVNRSHDKKFPIISSKYEYGFSGDELILSVLGSKIALVNKEKCKGSDFGLYPESFESSFDNYNSEKENVARAVTVQTNTIKDRLAERKTIAGWIRSAFADWPRYSGIEAVGSFFLPGEGGYEKQRTWENSYDLSLMRRKHWTIVAEIPVFRDIILRKATTDKVEINFTPFSSSNGKYDARILSSGIQGGRHVILQDILKWHESNFLFSNAALTVSSLKKIEELSASTIPPEANVLRDFEQSSMKEFSLIPVARRYMMAYSRKGLPIKLVWDNSGEFYFEKFK